MSIEVSSVSRFFLSESIIVDRSETFGLMTKHSFLNEKNLEEDEIVDFKVTAPFIGRPDLISNDVYGTPFLDWVVILFNSPRNTLNWPKNGDVIRVPNASVVLTQTL